jgi:beta-glucosidase
MSRWFGVVAVVAIVAVVASVAGCGSATATSTPTSAALTAASATPADSPSGRAWMDSSRTVDQRVAALLAEMTLDEKIGQMTQIENGSVDPNGTARFLLGSVLSGGDGNPRAANTAQNWYQMVSAYQQAALGTRLGIPIIYGVDAVHGDAHLTGTTVFPHNVGMGATRDAALVERSCQITAAETAATGVRWAFAPEVAVPQDARWGRTYEGYAENTDLVSQLAAACVKGLQGTGLADPRSVAANPKSYLGDGGTAFGSSTAINQVPYQLDQGVDEMYNATVEKLFLPPYQAAIKAGARIVMTSFSSTREGGRVTGDAYWLNDVLKKRLGFTGFVVSDWGAVDLVRPASYSAAVRQSVNAGVDMVMVPYDASRFQSTLKSLVASGDITTARIDDAVGRILRVKFEMGLFENPMPPATAAATVGSDANRAVARQAVAESAVLLQTGAGVLPIDRTAGRVLLAGAGADDIGIASGGWTISWQGQPGNVTAGTTLKAALATRLGGNLTYAADGSFPSGTRAPVGVVVVAERPYAEGVGDSATLALPAVDLAVVDRVRPLVDKLVVVVMSGRPVMLDGISSKADAVVAAWLPGTELEGLADVLLGAAPFVGTTPYTWPRTAADSPRIGKAACDGAVYPYGYGLDANGRTLGPAAC